MCFLSNNGSKCKNYNYRLKVISCVCNYFILLCFYLKYFIFHFSLQLTSTFISKSFKINFQLRFLKMAEGRWRRPRTRARYRELRANKRITTFTSDFTVFSIKPVWFHTLSTINVKFQSHRVRRRTPLIAKVLKLWRVL